VSDRGKDRLIYSSEQGRICPSCGRAVARCECRKTPGPAVSDGIVRIRREKKGRRGKTVTTISGLPLGREDLAELAGWLKRRCGSGGSAKHGVIEIQGDHTDTLAEALRERGYTVKRAGG
jgi:translation initiation factor 1